MLFRSIWYFLIKPFPFPFPFLLSKIVDCEKKVFFEIVDAVIFWDSFGPGKKKEEGEEELGEEEEEEKEEEQEKEEEEEERMI